MRALFYTVVAQVRDFLHPATSDADFDLLQEEVQSLSSRFQGLTACTASKVRCNIRLAARKTIEPISAKADKPSVERQWNRIDVIRSLTSTTLRSSGRQRSAARS